MDGRFTNRISGSTGGNQRPVVHALERDVVVYNVNRDLTFTRLETQDITLNTARALRQLDRSARTFYPDKRLRIQ